MDIIAKLGKAEIESRGANIPTFDAGDTLKVSVRVKEGDRSRVQAFEGLCIARHNKGVSSSFTVRKLSFGEGVERVFPLYSPIVEKIEVVRRGQVRRAKLYYLRGLTGKAARIAEKARAQVSQERDAAAVAEGPAKDAPAAEAQA